MQACKPGPVYSEEYAYHLSGPAVADRLNQPTLRHRTSSPYRAKARTAGLFGLSTRKVYPATIVTNSAVSSYPTFSPLLRGAVYFLWHFLYTIEMAPFLLGSTVLFVARTFLT